MSDPRSAGAGTTHEGDVAESGKKMVCRKVDGRPSRSGDGHDVVRSVVAADRLGLYHANLLAGLERGRVY